MLMAVEKWRHYLEGSKFVIKTDHESLKFLLQQKLHTQLQRKGMTKLMGLDYVIQYRKGKENLAADALSRCHEEGHSAALTVLVPDWHREVASSYENDESMRELLQQLVVDPSTKPGYTLINGLIRNKGRLVIGDDENLRKKIVETLHNSPIGGHSGIVATYHKVKQHFHWPGLKKYVMDWVLSCDVCKRCKSESVAHPGLLQPLNVPGGPWESISMDFIEGLPKSEGRDCIMVIVDRFTKYAHFIGLAHPYTAQEVAKVFLDQVVKLHGTPKTIVSDRDRIFTSLLWKELTGILGIQLSMSTAYHPESDGQTERVNQCLETYLRCACFLQPRAWHKWLALAQWWYNSNYHNSIKRSPFEALYGYKPTLLPDLGSSSTVAALDTYLQQRQQAFQSIKIELASAKNRMKQFADRRRSEREFQVGEWVYLKLQPGHLKALLGKPSSKLNPRYYGPFLVLARVGNVAYRLQLPESSNIHPVFHVSLLKKAIEQQAVNPELPCLPDSTDSPKEPIAILDRRVIYNQGAPIIQVLVQWSNLHSDNNTWEYLPDVLKQFPKAAGLLTIS